MANLDMEANTLRQQIEALLREYPDLANDEFLRADMLEGETDIKGVLTSIHHMISDAMALRDGTQPRLDDLISRRERMQQRIDFGRDLIAKILESAELRKIELPEATFSLRDNPRKLVGDPDPYALPDAFVKIIRTPDRKAIREALEAGKAVDGCLLSNAPPSLLVKVR